jgi:hypothetical protein
MLFQIPARNSVLNEWQIIKRDESERAKRKHVRAEIWRNIRLSVLKYYLIHVTKCGCYLFTVGVEQLRYECYFIYTAHEKEKNGAVAGFYTSTSVSSRHLSFYQHSTFFSYQPWEDGQAYRSSVKALTLARYLAGFKQTKLN